MLILHSHEKSVDMWQTIKHYQSLLPVFTSKICTTPAIPVQTKRRVGSDVVLGDCVHQTQLQSRDYIQRSTQGPDPRIERIAIQTCRFPVDCLHDRRVAVIY